MTVTGIHFETPDLIITSDQPHQITACQKSVRSDVTRLTVNLKKQLNRNLNQIVTASCPRDVHGFIFCYL